MALRLRFRGWQPRSGAQKGPWWVLVTKNFAGTYIAQLDKEAINWPEGNGATADEAVKELQDAWAREMRADYGPQDFVVTHSVDDDPTQEEQDASA